MSAILEVKHANAAGLSYTPLHPTIGAEVEGVDLSLPITTLGGITSSRHC